MRTRSKKYDSSDIAGGNRFGHATAMDNSTYKKTGGSKAFNTIETAGNF
jgi:hypothetical protein